MNIQILFLDTDCLIQKHKKETTIKWRLQKVIVPPAEQLNFEFYRKKTTRGEGLWKNKKAAAIVDNSGTTIANIFDLEEEVENNETKFKHK